MPELNAIPDRPDWLDHKGRINEVMFADHYLSRHPMKCIGGRLFTVLNLPVWSDGTKGWNYPGVISYVIFVAGITVFNTTLKEKARFWFWAAVIALAVILLLY